MGYRTILLHLNDERRMMRLLGPAVELAERWNAHLIAAAALPPLYVLPAGAPGFGDPIVIDEHRKAYQKEAIRIERGLREVSAGRAVVAQWRLEDAKDSSVATCIGALARSSDLIIASQTDGDWLDSHFQDVAERLITENGRPVLVIPNTGRVEKIGTRVLLAWNSTREAARAAFDALPFLKLAEQVIVVSISPSRDHDAADSGIVPTADLCATLARHGVKCTAFSSEEKSSDAGRTLLATATDRNCDLLVMGCYGHSRLREFILGGATRTVLKSMQIPVLMSH
jgi:nucleotide-binding universal stress UspA family protein